MTINEIARKEIERYLEQLKDRDTAILQLSGRVKELEELCEQAQRILETDATAQEKNDEVYDLLDGR